jgi:hypothetical protein
MRFSGVPVGGLGSLAVVATVLALGSGAPVRTLSRVPPGNRAAARGDAAAMVASLRLPAGSRRLSAEPFRDGGWLKPLPLLIGDLVLDFTWPPRLGVLAERELQVTITALSRSTTGVLAESQSVTVPR